MEALTPDTALLDFLVVLLIHAALIVAVKVHD